MTRKLPLLAALALFAWPVAIAHAIDDDDDDFLIQLDQRVTVLENAPDADTLGALSCTDGKIAKFDGTAWACAADEIGTDADTLGELSCSDGEIARFDAASAQWACAAPAASLLRTIVISPSSNAQGNCDALRSAMMGVFDNSAENPFLIKLEPGLYDCGSQPLFMKPFIDIEGSGANLTRIIGNPEGDDGGTFRFGVITGANNAELRQLTVEHIGGTQIGIAIDNLGASMRITDVTVTVSQSTGTFHFGIVAVDAQPAVVLSNVRVDLRAISSGLSPAILVGIRDNFEGEAVLENVTAIGSDGLTGFRGGRALVRNSILSGTQTGFINDGTDLGIASTQVIGEVFIAFGSPPPRCIGSFDGNFVPLDEFCAPTSP